MDLKESYYTEQELLIELENIGRKDEKVLKALDLDKKIHKDEFRKYENVSALEAHIYPTISLLVEHYVVNKEIPSSEDLASAALHDIKERFRVINNRSVLLNYNTIDELLKDRFGEEVFHNVDVLTKPKYDDFPGENINEKKRNVNKIYFPRIDKGSKNIKIVKLADRTSNLLSIGDTTDVLKIVFWLEEMNFYIKLAELNSPNYFYNKITERLLELKELKEELLTSKRYNL